LQKSVNILLIILFYGFCQNQVNGQMLDSKNGIVNNTGTITIRGQAEFGQASIGGRIEYVWGNNSNNQIIPQISYYDVFFDGDSPKVLNDTTKPLIARHLFYANKNTTFSMKEKAYIFSEDTTVNYGTINPMYTYGKVKLNGQNPQNIWGTGLYKDLELDNAAGADIVKTGGFRVGAKLELTRGQLRNDIDNNFVISDSAIIVRYVAGSLAYEPQFENRVDVQFKGAGQIIAGPELPKDSTKLQRLLVENTQGLILSKHVTANDSIYVGSYINTEPDTINKYILTYTSIKDPVFGNNDAEIIGSFRRTNLRFDNSRITFNNTYTYALFADAGKAGNVKELTFRIKPRNFPPFLNGNSKVKRSISITAADAAYNQIQNGVDMTVGYGFRNLPNDPPNHEANGLDVTKVKLQRWNGSQWIDVIGSQPTQSDTSKGWVFSFANNFTTFGEFAIGLSNALIDMFLAGQVMLEGAYRLDSKNMGDELRVKGLIPLTPPDTFPYNLDPKRLSYKVAAIPDSVVDWILIEFKENPTGGKTQYTCCFVKRDGKIVDRLGNFPLDLQKENIDSGDYYLAIRHRNHLGIITESPVKIAPQKNNLIVDFTKPENLLGRFGALKPIDFNLNGSLLFGMISGDVNGDGIIDDTDFISTWEDRDYEGYFRKDLNMNGIITTKDLNFAWNNRGKKSWEHP